MENGVGSRGQSCRHRWSVTHISNNKGYSYWKAAALPRAQVIEHYDSRTLRDQSVDNMRTNEACTTHHHIVVHYLLPVVLVALTNFRPLSCVINLGQRSIVCLAVTAACTWLFDMSA